MKKKNIIIDCDPGHDDVMAILLALANRESFNILGITTVAGNQTLAKVTNNIRRLLSYLDIYIPLACGASKPLIRKLKTGGDVHGETGLDGWNFGHPSLQIESDNAILFLRDKIMGADGKVSLVPIGPLTNIALLLSVFPETREKIELISLMGGAIYSGNRTPYAEFNIYVDPEAAKIVFDSGVPIVMSGLEVTHKASINEAQIEDLKKKDGKVSKMCGNLLYSYTRFHSKQGYSSYPIHDACSVMYLLHPEIFTGLDLQIEIDVSDGMYRGRTSADLREWVKGNSPNAKVLIDVDGEAFIRNLLNGFEKLDRESI